MYCSTCELEIKGDDKDTCPVCGAPLFDSHDDGSFLINEDQAEKPAIQGSLKDINSLIESEEEPETTAASEEEVFELKDYAPDSPDVDGAAPATMGDEYLQGRESVSEMLDSIRQSIAMPDQDEEEAVAAGNDRSGFDEDFGFFDSDKPDFSDFAVLDTASDTSAERAWGFDDAADALPAKDAPARKRSPALMIVLIVVLFVVGGYYAFSLTSDKAGRDDQSRTIRTVMPLAELQADAKLSTPAVDVSVPAGQAQPPVLVNADAPQSAQVDSQQPASEKSVETVASPAFVAPEAPPVSAPVAAEADASVKSESAPAEVAKPVETPAPAEPEALPKVSAEKAALVQSKPASAEVAKPAVSAAPVRAPFYTVHVGSYRTKAAASAEAERIKAKGHDAFVERADLGRRGIWYRVKVGRFKIRSEAEQLRKKIHKVLVQDSMVVRNRTD